MLEQMRIRGLGVIDEAVVDLGPGLTVVSGETGAGKTMVVTSLALLFGGRGDAGAVRPGAAAAVVEGTVRVERGTGVAERVREAGGELDDTGDGAEELLLARSLSAAGRSRAHVGGRAVPVTVLAELAEPLMALHGQSDQQLLLRPAVQRAALDRLAGADHLDTLARLRAAHSRWRATASELAEITQRGRERAQEADLLRLGLIEVDRVAPQPGEDLALAAETQRLGHADALRTAADSAHAALAGRLDGGGGSDAVSLAGEAQRLLEPVTAHDPDLDGLAQRVREAGYLLADVAADLASYAASVDADPLRLATAQDRRAALTGLTRKYGEDADAVLAWAERARARLDTLDGDHDRLDGLRAQETELASVVAGLATAVSAARSRAADALGEAVGAELAALAMPHARVTAALSRRPPVAGAPAVVLDGVACAVGPDGVDEVELLLAPHPGAPPRPVSRGASGGELSRVMLALEVVLAGVDPVSTMIFDEVDAGVGGAAAVEVGRRLARLARDHQVIVVTHLPQVAAFADRHLLVEKSSDGSVTRSGVRTLDRAGRVRELSRMLAGLADSALAQAHAEELLDEAAREVAAV